MSTRVKTFGGRYDIYRSNPLCYTVYDADEERELCQCHHIEDAERICEALAFEQSCQLSDEEIYTMASAVVDRCEKCPRTADGVIALPGMTIYPAHPIEPDDSMVLVLGGLCDGEWLRDGDELDISKCYSTPERAAAARAGGEGVARGE